MRPLWVDTEVPFSWHRWSPLGWCCEVPFRLTYVRSFLVWHRWGPFGVTLWGPFWLDVDEAPLGWHWSPFWFDADEALLGWQSLGPIWVDVDFVDLDHWWWFVMLLIGGDTSVYPAAYSTWVTQVQIACPSASGDTTTHSWPNTWSVWS